MSVFCNKEADILHFNNIFNKIVIVLHTIFLYLCSVKIIPIILAILLFGQSLRAGAEVLCCQTEAEAQNVSCHQTDDEMAMEIDINQPLDTEDNCTECHCPGCVVVTTTPISITNFPNLHFPNFANPTFFYENIHASDYTFSPWQPPKF